MPKLHFEIEIADHLDKDWLCAANLMLLLLTDAHSTPDLIKSVTELDDGIKVDSHFNWTKIEGNK